MAASEALCVAYIAVLLVVLGVVLSRWSRQGKLLWRTLTWSHITHDSRGLGPLRFGLIRLAMSFYVVCTLVAFLLESPAGIATFTIWCWTLIGLYLFLAGTASIVAAVRGEGNDSGNCRRPPVVGCILWIWFEAMFSTAILVFLVVWLVLLPFAYISTGSNGRLLSFLQLSAHNLNIVFMGTEMMLNRLTFLRHHAVFVLLYGCAYVIFSWCYFLWGEKHKFWYFFLDWRHFSTPVWYTLLMLVIWAAFTGGQRCVAKAKADLASDLPGDAREALTGNNECNNDNNEVATLPA